MGCRIVWGDDIVRVRVSSPVLVYDVYPQFSYLFSCGDIFLSFLESKRQFGGRSLGHDDASVLVPRVLFLSLFKKTNPDTVSDHSLSVLTCRNYSFDTDMS